MCMITSCQLEFYDQQDRRPSYNPEHHPHNGSGAIRSLRPIMYQWDECMQRRRILNNAKLVQVDPLKDSWTYVDTCEKILRQLWQGRGWRDGSYMLGNNSSWFLLRQRGYAVSMEGSFCSAWVFGMPQMGWARERAKTQKSQFKRPSGLLAFGEFSAYNAEQTYALCFRT